MTKLANAIIPVEDASIQRRQVTVEVLTLDKRQVTQSFYKQLVCREVIDAATCELEGAVWGWVNLHVDCNLEKGHIHAVWEKGGKLMRSCTPYQCGQVFYRENSQILKALAEVGSCLSLIDGDPIKEFIRVGTQNVYPDPPSVVKVGLMNFSYDYIKRSAIEQMHSIIRGMNDGYRWKYEWTDFDPDKERPRIWPEMERIAKEMAIEEQKWKRTYRSIQDAGQLFIAVSGVWK